MKNKNDILGKLSSKVKSYFTKRNGTTEIKNELAKYQNIAKKYLEIIREIESKNPPKGLFELPAFIDRRQQISINKSDFEFIEENSLLLQKQLNQFNLGVGSYREPFGMGVHRYFEFLSNFPTMYRDPVRRDEAIICISIIITSLSTYIQIIEDLLNNKEKLKEYLKNLGKTQKTSSKKKARLDKTKMIEIIFLGLYVVSLGHLMIPDYFIYGFIENLISVIAIIIISFIPNSNEE